MIQPSIQNLLVFIKSIKYHGLGNPNVYSERHSNGFLRIWSTDLSGKDVGKDLFTTNMDGVGILYNRTINIGSDAMISNNV